MLLPRSRARWFVEGAPVLLLPDVPQLSAMPPLRVTDDGRVGSCEGWRIAARLALVVVDGPGEHGIAVEGARGPGEDAEGLLAWCAAVDEHGGAVVLAFDGWDEATGPHELLALARGRGARGGTLAGVPPG